MRTPTMHRGEGRSKRERWKRERRIGVSRGGRGGKGGEGPAG